MKTGVRCETEKFKKYIEMLRCTAGWSMEELGNKLGVSKQTISNISSGGKTSNATYLTLRLIFEKHANVDEYFKKLYMIYTFEWDDYVYDKEFIEQCSVMFCNKRNVEMSKKAFEEIIAPRIPKLMMDDIEKHVFDIPKWCNDLL